MLLEVVHQLLRHRPLVSRIGQGRVVAVLPRLRRQSDLVLHLNHDDRVLRVHLLDMPHQGRKSVSVGVPVGVAEGAEHFDAPTPGDLDAREALEVLLDPVGRIAGPTVLPACEPQKRQTQVVAARIADDAVRHTEVELPFLGFDLRPGNAGQDGVEFGLGEHGPFRLHVLDAGRAVVTQFSAQHQEWLAIDNQLGGRPVLL